MSEKTGTSAELVRLASWVLLQLAGRSADISWDAERKTLVIQEMEDPAEGDPEIMEIVLESTLGDPDIACDLLKRLRESPNKDVIGELFSQIIGPEKAREVARTLDGWSHDDIIREAYKRTSGISDISDNSLVRNRERLVTDIHQDYERHNISNRGSAISRAVFSEYAREFALTLPGIIRKAEKLRLLHVDAEPPENVQKYISEATKCYLFGRYLAATVVCRAALEVALRSFLERNGQAAGIKAVEIEGRSGLDALLVVARRLDRPDLRQTIGQMDHVRRVANRAAHGDTPGDDECKDVIIETRGVLRDLFQ